MTSAGRQGDPGSSRFYIALDDDLMRLFGSERIQGLVDKIGLEEDMPIEHRMLTKSIESAQKKVEGKNFGIRKHVLEYDDVMNKQREIIEEDMPIEHRMLTKSIESAQKKVEGKNFGIRKHVLEYDDVMNKQREIIYKERRRVLDREKSYTKKEEEFLLEKTYRNRYRI